ncbi:Glycosyltransferase involved in cell wall bisynthesis [Paracoccus seriniphilus]|uniref:Glycosyltransferase involved in cell wall bisynthesis n=2 Tax=Paracoccus seriniphilus TaxID=184748 RepID=A0A239Q1I1_9RHOB|nr:glycosyltransferase family 4 protein [Paracoccus seriniphilus]SNT76062.1 Glycosyltransferase involved in cell wall bisynthesis [Paracoccus seriniphilus]
MPDDSLPKILIVAPNASARFGGEAFLPLNYFRILSRRGHPVHLIAHHRNQEELLSLPDCDPARMHFVPDTRWHRAIWRLFSRFPERVRDLIGGGLMTGLNEIYQARLIRKLVAEGEVDVIHQPIPVSPLIPSGLHRFGVPLVIGPMNGGMDYPPGYEDYEGGATRASIAIGRRVALLMNRLKPGKHRAAVLLVANERTRRALPNPRHPRIETLIENGIDFSKWRAPQQERSEAESGRLRLVFLGRFVRWKAIDITLQAVAMARRSGADVSLDLLGDGEGREELESLAFDLGIAEHVTFHGFKPQEQCAAILARSDALILNSLRECGGAVVLEAMAMGLPVVASAWGGPLDYLNVESGFLVHPSPREDFDRRLAGALVALAEDPALRQRMGQAGQKIVHRDFDWESKVDRMVEIYREAAAGK